MKDVLLGVLTILVMCFVIPFIAGSGWHLASKLVG